ncbi:hypothetical protein ACFSTE_02145 [Aquimarina hainanensis]|uniref:Uncharacterized protein n=1 Tax=Aquimarina hainanensis TaxID=1578017 RepID=A0ABW5N5Y5_9FLAO
MKTLFAIASFFLLTISLLFYPERTKTSEKFWVQNSKKQEALFFLDSIRSLNTKKLIDEITATTDSIHLNQRNINKILSPSDFEKLQQAIKNKEMPITVVKSIFGNIPIDSTYIQHGAIPITFFTLGQKKEVITQYAIALNDSNISRESDVYFFSEDTLLSRHHISHRYALDIQFYTDHISKKTIIYYTQNQISGSGTWEYHFNFYQYEKNGLRPILSEIAIANLQPPWSSRIIELHSKISKTTPLTMHIEYQQQLVDSENPLIKHPIAKDSIYIEYQWNHTYRKLETKYKNTSFSKEKHTSFYISQSDLLFLHAYQPEIRQLLAYKNPSQSVINYILEVKNTIRKK